MAYNTMLSDTEKESLDRLSAKYTLYATKEINSAIFSATGLQTVIYAGKTYHIRFKLRAHAFNGSIITFAFSDGGYVTYAFSGYFDDGVLNYIVHPVSGSDTVGAKRVYYSSTNAFTIDAASASSDLFYGSFDIYVKGGASDDILRLYVKNDGVATEYIQGLIEREEIITT